jgi:hypothetical protein
MPLPRPLGALDSVTYVQARRGRRQIGDGLMGMIAEPYIKVLRVIPLAIRIRGRLFVWGTCTGWWDHKPARPMAVDSLICKVLAS